MLVQTAHLNGTSRKEYDALLASGWFRGAGVIYRSEIVCIDSSFFSVRNIRISLDHYAYKKKHRKLLRRNDETFRVTYGKPWLNAEKETLYKNHLRHFKAFVHSTLGEVIFHGGPDSEFETLELCVYDGDKLVAVSYFDVAQSSMASIMCIYDHSYPKQSLGIYTMLKEMEYAQQKGMEYYYPGYVLDQPSSFDYKLSLGTCEWLINDSWTTIDHVAGNITRAEVLRRKMRLIHACLVDEGYEPVMRLYPYFTVGHVMPEMPDLLKMPCYYLFRDGEIMLGASYDVEADQYVVFQAHPVSDDEYAQHLLLSDDYRNSPVYELRIMKTTLFLRTHNLAELLTRAEIVAN